MPGVQKAMCPVKANSTFDMSLKNNTRIAIMTAHHMPIPLMPGLFVREAQKCPYVCAKMM